MSKAFGSLFGKKATAISDPTSFETLPEFGQQRTQQLLGQGFGIDPSQFQAGGLTPLQQQSINQIQGLQGIETSQPFQQSQTALGSVGNLINQGTQGLTPEQIQGAISTFQNPFEEQVVQSALRDLMQQGQGAVSDISSAFTQAGGFGSSRQTGAALPELAGQLAQASGDVSGRLRSQGFQQAAGLGLEQLLGDRNRQLQGAQLGIQQGGALGQLAQLQRGSQLGNIQASSQGGALQRQVGEQERLAPQQQAEFLANLLGIIPQGGGNIQLRENKGAATRYIESIAPLVDAIVPG